MLKLIEAKRIARQHGIGSLLTHPTANAKLAKSEGYYNAGISLAQASLSGYNMCHGSTEQCRLACLGGTGRAEYGKNIVEARINRTKLLATNPKLFWDILEPELHSLDRKAAKLKMPVAFRPNILSDQNWPQLFPQLFTEFPHWVFYSYTKIKSKVRQYINGKLPENYHVTYSWSERSDMRYVRQCIANGVNVAVPFYDNTTLLPTIPDEWKGIKVENGDKSDLRFLDPPSIIVGLSAKLPKSKAAKIKRIREANGFFVGV